MRSAELILRFFSFFSDAHRSVHLFFVTEVKSDCAVNLFQSQGGILSPNGFRGHTLVNQGYNQTQGDAAVRHIETGIALLNVCLFHSLPFLQSTKA
jgi:hypothetical protein